VSHVPRASSRRGNQATADVLVPERRVLTELLDDPAVDPVVRERSHRDIVRANTLFGGTRAALLALAPAFDDLVAERGARACATLLDVGTGLGDIAAHAREVAGRRGVQLHTLGLDGAPALVACARRQLSGAVCGDALALPFPDASVDFVLCSQLLHHFSGSSTARLIVELDRVAARLVVISDLRRSWLAAAGFWMASVALRFHPITRHDGTVSVLRGFTERELGDMVLTATGVPPTIRRRLGYRLTASWTPNTSAACPPS
jgi:SAM-dependent methyltransferase